MNRYRRLPQKIFSAILDSFKTIGVSFEQGIIRVTEFMAEKITTSELKIGSSKKPTGVTLYDETNGNPYCVKIRNGGIVSEAGTARPRPHRRQ